MNYIDTSLNEIIVAAQAALKRFPDVVERNYYDYPNSQHYYSKLVSKDSEVKSEYSGVWYNLNVRFYVEVPYLFNGESLTVKVNNDPSRYKVMKINNFEYSVTNTCTGEASWNCCEEDMLKDGFTETHIKNMYKQFIKKFSEADSFDIKLQKDNLPSYIKKLLLFS